MNGKILSFLKRITILMVILMLCTYSAVSAFSFDTSRFQTKTNMFTNIFGKFFNKGEYDLQDLKTDLENMRSSGNYSINDIEGLIDKLPEGENRSIIEGLKEMFLKFKEGISQIDLKGLLDKLIDAITSLLGGSSSSSLEVEPTSIYMNAATAVEFAGQDYGVKLHANVYKHIDANGNEDSDKWVILIHPFMLKGTMIANRVGPYYYEKGYNILAPDLRSFGESEGEVALGFLESLDMYDWLNLLNTEYNPSQVIVHGISLGGATTNFLSGIDGFINNGPTKINTQIKSLRELKVVGLVEDCGYTNMTQFANESFLLNMNIGLTKENFEYYSDATNSLKYCDIPMLIIQGSNDTMVKPENAETVKNTVKGEVDYWLVDGGPHAFIIIGSNAEEYKSHVQNFIDTYANGSTDVTPDPGDTPEQEPSDEPEQKPSDEEETQTGLKGIFEKIMNYFKSWGSRR